LPTSKYTYPHTRTWQGWQGWQDGREVMRLGEVVRLLLSQSCIDLCAHCPT